ncbi:MAG: hypothetical protein ABFS86_06440 [Planctomycetota bacterium]
MRHARILIVLAFCLAPASAVAVEGDWHTTAASAFTAAAKSKTPILAVAMDHG